MAKNQTVARADASSKGYKAPNLTIYGSAIYLTAAGTKPAPEGSGSGNVIKKP